MFYSPVYLSSFNFQHNFLESTEKTKVDNVFPIHLLALKVHLQPRFATNFRVDLEYSRDIKNHLDLQQDLLFLHQISTI